MPPDVTYPRRVALDAVLVASTASDLRMLGWLDHLRQPGSGTVAIESSRLGADVDLRPERLRAAMNRTARVLAGPRGGALAPAYAGHRIEWSDNPVVHVTLSDEWLLLADDVRDVTMPHAEFRALDTRCAYLCRLRAAGHLRDRDEARVRYGAGELAMLTGQRRVSTHVAVRDNLVPAGYDLARHAPTVRQHVELVSHEQHAERGGAAAGEREAGWARHVSVRWRRAATDRLAA